jgi:hypothetical protein
MEKLVERFPDAGGTMADVLNQAARELLLLESSDWPFLVTTGQAKDYATQRFTEHVERFEKLADAAESIGANGGETPAWLDELRYRDNPFPTIDYRAFGRAAGPRRLGHPNELRERDPDPVGPIVQLVDDLVDRLLELERGQRLPDRLRASRGKTVVPLSESRCRYRSTKAPRAPAEPCREQRVVDVPLHLGANRSDRVGEGAEHPRDVAQGRVLRAPLGERR